VNPLTQQDIFRARGRITSLVRQTPLVRANALSAHTGEEVFLKLEMLQPTGSFKVRGAANKLLSLSNVERAQGVVTVSTGNHGRAVAYVARALGIAATVCISKSVPENKVEAIRALGASLVIHGISQDEAEVRAKELAAGGLTLVHPFDDPYIISGQGTIGLELLEDLPELTTALVPLSGGGLIAGVALALKSANPKLRLVGVSMERGPVMVESLKAGRPLELPEDDTLADSLKGGIGLANRYTFGLVQRLVDETVLVSEKDIAGAMRFSLHHERLVLEGAAAVGVAALLSRRVRCDGPVAVIASGGNVAVDVLLNSSP
jgi:threonine dehydratase